LNDFIYSFSIHFQLPTILTELFFQPPTLSRGGVLLQLPPHLTSPELEVALLDAVADFKHYVTKGNHD
jgi:hypothetical protein